LLQAIQADVPKLFVIQNPPRYVAQWLRRQLQRVFAAATRASDQPGSLGDICSRLSGAGINIDYAYTGITQTPGKAIVVMVVSDLDKAAKIVG